MNGSMSRLQGAIEETARSIAEELAPPLLAFAHEVHALEYELLWPWWRRYWHLLRGCPWGKRR